MKYIIIIISILFTVSGYTQKVFQVKYESQADIKVFFVKYESQADLKVYYVNYQSQAGWKNNSKKHLLKFKTK
jgi:hypothetical protein